MRNTRLPTHPVLFLCLILSACTPPPVTEVTGDTTGRTLTIAASADDVFRATVETLDEYGFPADVVDYRRRALRTGFRSASAPLSDGRPVRAVVSVEPVEPDDARLTLLLVRPSPGGRLPQTTEPPESLAYRELLDAIKAKAL